MKKHTVSVVFCVLVLGASGVIGWVMAAEKCYQPSIHQKPCSDRPNMVSGCAWWASTVCLSKRMYTTPQNVPDGKVEADSGSTFPEQIWCVKEYGCEWNPNHYVCFDDVNWDMTPESAGVKIIDNPNVKCPPPG